MKGGSVTDSPSCAWCPPSRLRGGRVEGRVVLCVVPAFGLGSPLHIVLPLLHSLSSPLPLPLFVFSVTACWFVVCLCDRVVSLGNSGDGLCRVEGRVVSTVHYQLFMCGVWCGMAVGVGVCGLVVVLSVSVPVSLVGGVRGSARAAMRARTLSPNTIVFSCCVFFSLSAPRLSLRLAFPVIVEWRCVIHHVLVCCVGMTATGSLSRSSSFFW